MSYQQKSRTTGVMAISVWYVISALFVVLISLLFFAGGALLADIGLPGGGGFVAVLGLIVLVLGLIIFAVAYGLWNMTEWGWLGGLILGGLGVVGNLFGAIEAQMSAIVFLIIYGAIVWYLWDNQDLFRT